MPDNIPPLTPVEEHADILVKRDDTYTIAGQRGGKVRTCWHLATTPHQDDLFGPPAAQGLVTASSRHSPQAMIVAAIAHRLGIPARLHMPTGPDTPETDTCLAHGAKIITHTPGYNTVLIRRAKDDAGATGYRYIPFGMECPEAVTMTSHQTESLVPLEFAVDRLVVPVGSGMSLAGIIAGMRHYDINIPILGVMVGADPRPRLTQYAPGWALHATLVQADLPYHRRPTETNLGDLALDPVYEAKTLPFLEPRDLLWVVGNRTQTPATQEVSCRT